MIIVQTAVATLLLLVAGALGLSWLNTATIQHLVNVRGKNSSQLWLTKPGLWLHELSHALLGRLFGMQIADFSVHDGPQASCAGHVTLRFRQQSLWQRFGLFFAGGAPLWVSGALELISARYVFWPQVPLALINQATFNPDWRWALAWLVGVFLINLGASLSAADIKMMLRGLPVAAVLLVIVALLLWAAAPAVLTQWVALNWLLARLIVMLGGIAGGTWLLCRVLYR